MLKPINIIFSDGACLAGVHEALNIEIARELASRLQKQTGVMSGEQNAKL